MKKSDVTTAILFFGVVALLVSSLLAHKETKGTTLNLKDMTQVQCDDIVRMPNATTGKSDLVCEITMVNEDDNMVILKEN